jgi:hypothetical protein
MKTIRLDDPEHSMWVSLLWGNTLAYVNPQDPTQIIISGDWHQIRGNKLKRFGQILGHEVLHVVLSAIGEEDASYKLDKLYPLFNSWEKDRHGKHFELTGMPDTLIRGLGKKR